VHSFFFFCQCYNQKGEKKSPNSDVNLEKEEEEEKTHGVFMYEIKLRRYVLLPSVVVLSFCLHIVQVTESESYTFRVSHHHSSSHSFIHIIISLLPFFFSSSSSYSRRLLFSSSSSQRSYLIS